VAFAVFAGGAARLGRTCRDVSGTGAGKDRTTRGPTIVDLIGMVYTAWRENCDDLGAFGEEIRGVSKALRGAAREMP